MSDRTSPIPPEGVEVEQAPLDDSASEYVAERLAKLDAGQPMKAVGEEPDQPGMGGALTPQHPATGSAAAGQPETPSAAAERASKAKAKGKGKAMPPVQLAQAGAPEGAAEGGPAAAAAAAGHHTGFTNHPAAILWRSRTP